MDDNNKPDTANNLSDIHPFQTSNFSYSDNNTNNNPRDNTQYKHANKLPILALVVLFVVIAGLSYLLTVTDKETKNSEFSVSQSPKVAIPMKNSYPKNKSEAEYKVYSSAEYGLSFSYPNEWGDVEIANGRETEHLVSENEKEISFTSNPSVAAGFKSIAQYSFGVKAKNVDVIDFHYYGNVYGQDYVNKESYWDNDKIESSKVVELFKKNDSRIKTL